MRDADARAWLERELITLLTRREMYGSEMAEAVVAAWASERVLGAQPLSEGMIYPVLRRLERSALLSAQWVHVAPSMPRRRFYALTPKGRRVASSVSRASVRPVQA